MPRASLCVQIRPKQWPLAVSTSLCQESTGHFRCTSLHRPFLRPGEEGTLSFSLCSWRN